MRDNVVSDTKDVKNVFPTPKAVPFAYSYFAAHTLATNLPYDSGGITEEKSSLYSLH